MADPSGFGNRLLEACLALLMSAMALYGAVVILEAIWVQLCVIATVAAVLGAGGWIVWQRFRRW